MRSLKHQVKQVKECIGKDLKLCVMFPNQITPVSNGHSNRIFGGSKVPKKFIVTELRQGNKDGNHIVMVYLNPDNAYAITIAEINQFDELKILTGTTARLMLKRYE